MIVQALVNDIEPAHKVKEAMNEINAARRLRVAALERAEAEKTTVIKVRAAAARASVRREAGGWARSARVLEVT